jgi:hypothetical protein
LNCNFFKDVEILTLLKKLNFKISGQKGFEIRAVERVRLHPIRDLRSSDESVGSATHD